jgi:hypothetical protein
MPNHDPHPAAQEENELLAQCDVRRQRRAGPGGQHRNKVETGIVLLHRSTGVLAEATERRSQAENRHIALRRLRISLAVEIRRAAEADRAPSRLWQSRCSAGRITVSSNHPDFPTLLAEALDVLAAHQWQVSEAAGDLQCSASQLVKFLKLEPRAFARLNGERRSRGLKPLR